MRKLTIFLILLGAMVALLPFPGHETAYGQTEVPETPPAAESDLKEPVENSALSTLGTLLDSRKELREQLRIKKREYRSAKGREVRAALKEEIGRLEAKLEILEQNIEKIATGVNMDAFSKKPREKFDWQDEILELAAPIVQELKKMTARPRQIEKLRTEIAFYENRIDTIKKAIKNVEALSAQVEKGNEKLRKELAQLKESWEDRQAQANEQLKVSRYQLDELLAQKQSFWESGQKILKMFFKSRGRNFILSLLAFFVVFFLMRYFHRFIYRFSPIHQKAERTFLIRLTDVLYHVLTVIGAVTALLVVLYISGDWLLLSFAIILLFGIAWAAKEGLPHYWRQIQLMLNLGTVRENERIVYNGVPWKVVTLNVYAQLQNPAFQPTTLRVPLRDIMDLNSRPYDKSEPWFPCNIGEWVILSDGTRGEVISQTPEMVRLVLRGGSQKTYQTQDFLGLSPMNISADFRLKVVFGFDYDLQPIVTEEIPAKLTEALKQGITARGYGEDIIQIKVETECAGASSLDLVIIADFNGKVAAFYNVLKRLIQKLTIEACTANDWGIPFPQLTVHPAEVFNIRTAEAQPFLLSKADESEN